VPSYAYFHNQFVPLAEANIGIMTHSLHYGTAVFEGIRGNWNPEQEQLYLFRLKEHYQRLLDSCRLLQTELPYTVDELSRITTEMAEKSSFRADIYVRPLAYKGSQQLGLRLHGLEAEFLVFAIPWGPYLDMESARCLVSSWRRPADDVIPPHAKVTGLYVNNSLAKSEAVGKGCDEAIMLSPDGHVSEGTGENIFLVIDGKLVTPDKASSILLGITRSTVMELARNELGIDTEERPVERDELYSARECFFTGTAVHITPIAEIDGRPIADGRVGEVTAKLQKLYFDIIRGSNPKYIGWCTPVYEK